MARLTKRRGIWQISYFVGGRQYRTSLRTRDEKLARIKLAETEYLLATRRLHLPSKTPMPELLDAFKRHLRAVRTGKSAYSGSDVPKRSRLYFSYASQRPVPAWMSAAKSTRRHANSSSASSGSLRVS